MSACQAGPAGRTRICRIWGDSPRPPTPLPPRRDPSRWGRSVSVEGSRGLPAAATALRWQGEGGKRGSRPHFPSSPQAPPGGRVPGTPRYSEPLGLACTQPGPSVNECTLAGTRVSVSLARMWWCVHAHVWLRRCLPVRVCPRDAVRVSVRVAACARCRPGLTQWVSLRGVPGVVGAQRTGLRLPAGPRTCVPSLHISPLHSSASGVSGEDRLGAAGARVQGPWGERQISRTSPPLESGLPPSLRRFLSGFPLPLLYLFSSLLLKHIEGEKKGTLRSTVSRAAV